MLQRQVLLTLWAILVPELMVPWAVREWFDADKVVRDRAARSLVGRDELPNHCVDGEVDDENKGAICGAFHF